MPPLSPRFLGSGPLYAGTDCSCFFLAIFYFKKNLHRLKEPCFKDFFPEYVKY